MLNRQEKGATMTNTVTPGTQEYKALRGLDNGPRQIPRLSKAVKMTKFACSRALKALKRKELVEYDKPIGWFQTPGGAAEMDRLEVAL